MASEKIHYSGGIRGPVGRMFTVRLAGWPCCCSGDRAQRIADSGNQTRDKAAVTCLACRRLIDAADAYAKSKAADAAERAALLRGVERLAADIGETAPMPKIKEGT